MEPFAHAYGIAREKDADGCPLACLTITEPYLNGFGCAFGGCLIVVANTAAQLTVGTEMIGSNYTFRYLRKAMLGETMRAKTTVIKRGRTTATTETAVTVGDRLIGTMYADFFIAGESPAEGAPFDVPPALGGVTAPEADVVLNGEGLSLETGAAASIVQMFTGAVKRQMVSDLNLKGEGCFGIHTDHTFCDASGHIDPALLGMLSDEALGHACISSVGPCFTTSLTMNLFKSLEPGTFVTCSAEALMKSGRLWYARGELYGDGELIGCCSGTYWHSPAPNA